MTAAVAAVAAAGEREVLIHHVMPVALVLSTKERPRLLALEGTDGICYHFVLKANDDLRQHQRILMVIKRETETCRDCLFMSPCRWFHVPLLPRVSLSLSPCRCSCCSDSRVSSLLLLLLCLLLPLLLLPVPLSLCLLSGNGVSFLSAAAARAAACLLHYISSSSSSAAGEPAAAAAAIASQEDEDQHQQEYSHCYI